MSRKIPIILLVCCLLLTMIPVTAFAASTELVIETPQTLPKAGEEFTVTVSIRSNPGFNAIDLCLAFDNTQMSCKALVLEGPMSSTLSAVNPAAEGGAIFSAASISTISKDGVLARYYFKALKDVDAFDFSLTNTSLYDNDGVELELAVVSGKLESSADSESTEESGQPSSDIPAATGEDEQGSTEEQQDTPVQVITFTDVSTHWGKEAIAKAAEKKLFNGYTDGSFRPDNNVSRAEFVTVLWKMAGQPECTESTPFTDVRSTDWFATAVAWAYSNGYVSGTSKTTFGPSVSVSRQQAMTMLFKYSGGVSGMEAMFTSIYDQSFIDSSQISSWAKAPMYWGVYNKLISGTSATTLSPEKPATRAQLAVILVYYCDEYNK